MSNILVVLGSARKGRVAEKVAEYVTADIEGRADQTAVIADLKEINLPFFDNEHAPASPDYTPTNDNVIAWQKMVSDAHAVVFITPEYNHSVTAIQKNAIDSLGLEWGEKPVAVVAYGWSGGSDAVAALQPILTNLKADVNLDVSAKLAFMKDINPDGSLLDETSVAAHIEKAIDSIAQL